MVSRSSSTVNGVFLLVHDEMFEQICRQCKPKDFDIILICFPTLQLPIRRPMVRKLTVGGSWSMLKEAEPSKDGCHGDLVSNKYNEMYRDIL